MLDAIQKEFPASVSWTKPEGGMFIWVTLPEHMDSAKLLEKAIAQNVASCRARRSTAAAAVPTPCA